MFWLIAIPVDLFILWLLVNFGGPILLFLAYAILWGTVGLLTIAGVVAFLRWLSWRSAIRLHR